MGGACEGRRGDVGGDMGGRQEACCGVRHAKTSACKVHRCMGWLDWPAAWAGCMGCVGCDRPINWALGATEPLKP